MVEVKDLHKSYGKNGKIKALKGVSFTVDDGEISWSNWSGRRWKDITLPNIDIACFTR